MLPRPATKPIPGGDGRTAETAGAARPAPSADIPVELIGMATRAAELRIDREGLSARILDVVLREVWIEAQALAMEDRLTFEAAVDSVLSLEVERSAQE